MEVQNVKGSINFKGRDEYLRYLKKTLEKIEQMKFTEEEERERLQRMVIAL